MTSRGLYDVIVVGLGGMGSAAAYQLAGRHRRVLGLEQFTPAHDRGSSHGQSRIIRKAYFEAPDYVPLVLRSYELWRQLEHETGVQLLRTTGGLMLGASDSAVVSGSIRSAQEHGLPHEILDAAALRKRFPPFRPPAGTLALFETDAGALDPEAAVRAHLDRAAHRGAGLHFREAVLDWRANAGGKGVVVSTRQGRYEAERLVITAGPWAAQLLQSLALPLAVERQVQFWFEPLASGEAFLPERFPIYVWELPDGASIYGFPALGGPADGIKAAIHHRGSACSPDTIDREVHADEIDRMRAYLAAFIPDLAGPCLRAVTCMYTNTPDLHFIIALHPEYPQVALAAGFSGHGFKFVPVVGEILADLALTGSTAHPITLFTPERFRHGPDQAGIPPTGR